MSGTNIWKKYASDDDGTSPPDDSNIIPLRQPSQEEEVDETVSVEPTFYEYISDTKNVSTVDRNRFILATCHGVVPNFSLKTTHILNRTIRCCQPMAC